MTQRLTTTAPDFAAAFTDLVDARREADEDVSRDVTAILKAVRANGDAALADYTQRFDHHDLNVTGWAVTATETRAALDTLSTPLRDALELAAARITAYHEKQKPVDSDGVDSAGVRLGARWSAVDAAGLYVPGGRAAYPSSLLMNVIPAKVAGVQRIAMVTPTPNGEINPLVLAAAQIAGIEEIWRVGGAQAVAALAYGTDRIAPVDVITGPGNAWVAEAKRQLYGVVGIDMVAGPSEIVVVADGRNNPDWIAADLLSQSEHDPIARSTGGLASSPRKRSPAPAGPPMARSSSCVILKRRCRWSTASPPNISNSRWTILTRCSPRYGTPDRFSWVA